MDRSLDEIIEGSRPPRAVHAIHAYNNSSRNSLTTYQPRGGRRGDNRRPPPPRAPRREDYPRDGVRKHRNDDRANLSNEWVHDRYDGGDPPYNQGYDAHDPYNDRSAPVARAPRGGTKIRVDNISYDLLESDIHELFERVGPTLSVELLYDRSDRSTGTAFVVYADPRDADQAIIDYNNQYANGQVIKLTLVPDAPALRRGPPPSLEDRMDMPRRSLLDRMDPFDQPRRSRQRSDSPRRSDVRGPAPENIDRYVPNRESRSPPRRRGTPRGGRGAGRRPGERNERRPRVDEEGHRMVGGRPRKTAEELDAEMDGYWATGSAAENGGAGAGEDVDMVT